MDDCIFCKIIRGEIPADKLYEDEHAIVIRDINPQAPFHFLAIPRKHYPGVHDIPPPLMGEVFGGVMNAYCKALEACGLVQNGYRLVANSGEIAGQTVPHLHIHVLGGRELSWPPG
ncbi:MAG: histidine triad nucleotide-binding protein [Chitinispirillia bacterium]|nr:histidine triad nucleotide-binding protein [Chitinispirillia bacterium]MCL2267796.1 histidine triad nucleotide-binding protein [Chitinispirillia bacterium]